MSTPDDAPVRPRWSISEAARRTGKSRATIGRHLAKGAFPDAVQTEQGWSIPLDNLLAAGFTPDRPAPPDPAPEVLQQAEQLRAADALAQRAQAAEQALAEVQRALEQERAERLTAQAVAAERAEQITDLRRAVAALEAARPAAPSPAPAQQAAPPATPAPVPAQRRGLLGRTFGNLVDRGW